MSVAGQVLYSAGNAGGDFRCICGWAVWTAVEAVGLLGDQEGGEGSGGEGLFERAGTAVEAVRVGDVR